MIANTSNTSTFFLKTSVKALMSTMLITSMVTVGVGCSSELDESEVTAEDSERSSLKVVNYMILGSAQQMANVSRADVQSIQDNQQMHQLASNSTRTLTGQVVASKNTKISFDTQGTITHIYPKLGDRVKRGQVLAKIDTTNYQLKYNQATSQLKKARNEYNKAANDLNRREELLPIGAVSKNEVESFRLSLRTAKETVSYAKSAVALAKKQLNDTKLIAPISGTITAKLSEVGQFSDPSIPVLAIANEEKKEVSISVPETLLSHINLGQPMGVYLPALSINVDSKVTEISAQATAGSFPVTLQLIDTPNNVKSGMTAETSFELKKLNASMHESPKHSITSQTNKTPSRYTADAKVFFIPPSALGSQNAVTHTNNNPEILPNATETTVNSHYVFKINYQDGKASIHKTLVKVHDLTGKSITVSGKLNAGDLIVSSGISLLKDKQQVSLMGQGTKRVNP